jgi:hypothetical protein
MNEKEKREWIEIGKMMKKYHPNNTCPYIKTTKEKYFEDFLNIKDSVEIELEFPTDLLNQLYEMSDEKDITIDELINEILKEYMDKIKVKEEIQYRLLSIGDIIRENDEFYSDGNGWINIHPSLVGSIYYKELKPCRRKIEIISGYRLLNDGEIFEEGDEYFSLDNYKWYKNGKVPNSIFNSKKHLPVRRKIT